MASTNDPISDLLTRIRNAVKAKHRYVDVAGNKMNKVLISILKDQGFIENFMVKEDDHHPEVRIFLKYVEGRTPVISEIKRISKPGLRKYVGYTQIPLIYGGLGISIVSTSRGVMVGHEARKQKLGGELIACIW